MEGDWRCFSNGYNMARAFGLEVTQCFCNGYNQRVEKWVCLRSEKRFSAPCAQQDHLDSCLLFPLLIARRYVDRIANAKWEVKELGMEHNWYVDLLLRVFKHYKTRLAHGGIQKEVQELLLKYGLKLVAETIIKGLSRVKKCFNQWPATLGLHKREPKVTYGQKFHQGLLPSRN
ncbi:hypothetical protein SLA2020_245080 [Shorea laevis]